MSTILVVEDQAACRDPLARLLRLEGFEVLPAANGVDAVRILEREPIDLVLLDLNLPKVSGMSLLKIIRADARWMKLPVIVLTGSTDSAQIRRTQTLKANAVLTKMDFTVDELLGVIRKCMPDSPLAV